MKSGSVKKTRPISREAVETLIAGRVGEDQVPKKFKIITDTSDFFRVEYNDVVILGEIATSCLLIVPFCYNVDNRGK